jgi:hypothetical protein
VSSPPLDHGSIAVARWLSSPPCALVVRCWCRSFVYDRPVGNPKRRYDEHSSKSSLSMKPRFIEPVGERTKLQKVDAC